MERNTINQLCDQLRITGIADQKVFDVRSSPRMRPFLPSFRVFLCLFVAIPLSLLASEKIETLRLDPAPNMSRAELHFIQTVPNPRAVLVLCPGCNSNGEGLIRSRAWREFARNHNLGLAGLSFASPMPAIHDGSGYYYASRGSGEKLLEGIRTYYGKELPLLLYGFSGGAHFTSRFEEWNPDQVLAWCAYSAGWWDAPRPCLTSPPGIVACGDEDDRYGASMIYFKQGRASGKPWLWVSLPKTTHTGSPALDEFVRSYFSVILSSRPSQPLWIDIDTKSKLSSPEETHPSLTGWLPSEKLFDRWEQIHEP